MKWNLTFKRNGIEVNRKFETEEDAREYIRNERDYSKEHGVILEVVSISEN